MSNPTAVQGTASSVPEATGQSVTLRSQFQRIVRRWPTLLVVWVLVLLAAVYAGSKAPTTYTADSSIRVDVFNTNPQATLSSSQKVDIATEKEVAQSQEVHAKASDALKGHYKPGQIKNLVKVSTVSNTAIMTFEATASKGQDAADLANAMAQAYLDSRGAVIQKATDNLLVAIDQRLAELQKDDKTYAHQIAELRSQRVRTQLISTNIGEVLTQAKVPSSPSSNGMSYYLLAGTVGGLILGLIAAYIRDRTDRRVRYADRAGELWGVEPFRLNGSELDESARLLRRRLGSGSRRARGVAVLSLPAQAEDAEELVYELNHADEADTHADVEDASPWTRTASQSFSVDRIDSHLANELDDYSQILVLSTATTRRSELKRLVRDIATKADRDSTPLFRS